MQNKQQQYSCPHCKGTGREHLIPDILDIITGYWADDKCPNCQGTGKVKDPSQIRTNTGWFG